MIERNKRELQVTMPTRIEKVYDIFEYCFQDSGLLRQALTHSSENPTVNYERLEFLGDAVLELMVSEYLFVKFPDLDEGDMTNLRSRMVCEESLSNWARRKGLGAHLILGRSEEKSRGREKNSILCDVTEAVIGAIYLDGGFEMAKKAVSKLILELYIDREEGLQKDAKSELQILIQHGGSANLAYRLKKQSGPPHNAVFYVDVELDGRAIGSGWGKTKKQAEQYAAQDALEHIKKQGD